MMNRYDQNHVQLLYYVTSSNQPLDWRASIIVYVIQKSKSADERISYRVKENKEGYWMSKGAIGGMNQPPSLQHLLFSFSIIFKTHYRITYPETHFNVKCIKNALKDSLE